MSKTDEFNAKVEHYQRVYSLEKHEAHAKVCRDHPALREAMVAEHNQKHNPGNVRR